MHLESGFRIAPNWPKIGKMTIRHNFRTWRHRQVFWRRFFSLMKFSYWSKFQVNIITGSGVNDNFLFTRNPEIGNTPIWVLPNIWRLRQFWDSKINTNVSSKLLLNATKCQGYNFYRFRGMKGKPTGWVKLPPPYPD